MLHAGRDKPHLYKRHGYWVAIWSNEPRYRIKKAAMDFVDKLNRDIRNKAKP